MSHKNHKRKSHKPPGALPEISTENFYPEIEPDENEDPGVSGSLASGKMTIEDVIERLNVIRVDALNYLEQGDVGMGWEDDIAACEAAAGMLAVLSEEGIGDTDGVRDLIFDYRAQARDSGKMYKRFLQQSKLDRDEFGIYRCPECNERNRPGGRYCWYCGKRLAGV